MASTVTVPQINTNDRQLEVVAWHIAADAYVEIDQEVVDVETSKAVVTLTAETAGYLRPLVAPGSVVAVGAPLYRLAPSPAELEEQGGKVEVPGAGPTPQAVAPPAVPVPKPVLPRPVVPRPVVPDCLVPESLVPESLVPEPVTAAPRFETTRFSKAAARLVAERGLSPADFAGAGLVTVQTLDGRRPVAGPPAQAVVPRPAGRATPATLAPARSAAISLSKQAEIDALTWGEAGNVNSLLSTSFKSAALRRRLREEDLFDGNIQPIMLFEIARLLINWPQFTAFFEDGQIHYYDAIHLGLAIDMGKGLKVCAIPHADTLMPIDLFRATLDIAARYRDNKLTPAELTSSTITVSDLSGLNVASFHPLINGRQSVIIGIGGDAMQDGHPMSITMTFDHRVSNGREVAMFLADLRDRILSYAEPAGGAADQLGSLVGVPASDVSASCDSCGIGGAQYYRDYPRNGRLFVYRRADGSLGAACHRCAGGFI